MPCCWDTSSWLHQKTSVQNMRSTQCAVYGIMVPCFFFFLFCFCGTKFNAIFTMSRKSALGFCQLKWLHCPNFLTCKVQSRLPFFSRDLFVLLLSIQPLLTFYLAHFNLFKLCAHLHGSNNLRFLKPVMYWKMQVNFSSYSSIKEFNDFFFYALLTSLMRSARTADLRPLFLEAQHRNSSS